MIWENIDVDPGEVRDLKDRFGVNSLLSSILIRRGFNAPEDMKFFLEDDPRYLYNPFLFKDMEDVVDRINQGVYEEEKVLVFGDKDVDGVTSCVILYETLISIGLDASWGVPTGQDSYGLSIERVNRAYDESVSLIITVDCGISAFDAISRAKELGIDVIILDHHNPRDGELPDADFIINPRLDGCTYPFKGLAACGVVSKVVWALSLSTIETLYKSQVTLFHIEKKEDDYILSGIKLYNLVELDRISLLASSGDFTTLYEFLKGEQILVYNESSLRTYIGEIFGKGVEFNFIDISKEIYRVLPSVAGYSLEELTKFSKLRKYHQGAYGEVDTISNLFITYILKRYEDRFELFNNSLDLVALGTVADLMPLIGENRILVKKGLNSLEATSREGLRSLLLKLNLLGKKLTSKDISWVIAPIINSAGRMSQANRAVELLLCPDTSLKNKLVLNITALNRERRELSENLWSSLNSDFYDSLEKYNKKIIVVYNKDMVKGVTGLIASRALSTFGVPVIIIAKEGDKLIGSIRSSGNLNVKGLFEKSKDLLIDYGGHNCAGGFSLKAINLKKFEDRILKVVGTIIEKSGKEVDKLKLDANIPLNYLSPDIINICDTLEPYGESNKPLNFGTKDVVIEDIDFVGKTQKKHLKLLLKVGDYRWPALYWNSAELAGTLFSKGDRVKIAYRVERNFYGGNETLQLNILDLIK